MTSIWPIIPALFLVLLPSYHSQNYAGILASPLASSIILGSFTILSFPKLWWHIGLTPTTVIAHSCLFTLTTIDAQNQHICVNRDVLWDCFYLQCSCYTLQLVCNYASIVMYGSYPADKGSPTMNQNGHTRKFHRTKWSSISLFFHGSFPVCCIWLISYTH